MFTDKAKAIMDRGFNAFLNMGVRPDQGHTRILNGNEQDPDTGWQVREGAPTLKFGCVVGAIAYEAAALQGLSDARVAAQEDDTAKEWVSKIFDVSTHEVVMIEQGFDSYFECDEEERATSERRFEGPNSPPEMWQVGWHVAKRATKHYQDLDTAEEEAWTLYAEKGLGDYKPRSFSVASLASLYATDDATDNEIAQAVQKFLDECEGEDCPDSADELMALD